MDRDAINGLLHTYSNGRQATALGYALGYCAASGHTFDRALWEVAYDAAGATLDLDRIKAAIDWYFA